jgi:transposase
MEAGEVMVEGAPRIQDPGGPSMLSDEQWGAVRSLAGRGMGRKAIARQLGLDPKTVRKYLRRGGRVPYRRPCPVQEALEREHGGYLEARAAAVNWCAQVLLQELQARGYTGSYDAVKRWVAPRRETQQQLEQATVRFETGPGRQAQVDWGSTAVEIAVEMVRVHLFVMTLGFSRRMFVRAYANERLAALIDGHERAFAHFGGRTDEILYDNPRTIVERRDRAGKHIEWNPHFRDFADHAGFQPRLCRPYRARTKGKVESGVKYVKRNALIGRAFPSFEALNDWLLEWALTIADRRVHGTTHEVPAERFARETLTSVAGLAPFRIERSPQRWVSRDCLVNFETNRYSVPWRLVGQAVEVAVVGHELHLLLAGTRVARHALCPGKYQVIRDPEHFAGLLKPTPVTSPGSAPRLRVGLLSLPEVEVRDLGVYEAVAEGGGR